MPRFLRHVFYHTPTHLLVLRRKVSTQLGLVDNARIRDDRYDFTRRVFMFKGGDEGHTVAATLEVAMEIYVVGDRWCLLCFLMGLHLGERWFECAYRLDGYVLQHAGLGC